jgi:drug/metabolite transporter (DMT)-like permease
MVPSQPEPAPPVWLKFSPAIFVFLWSTGFVGAKFGLPYAEPFSLLALRFFLSGSLLMLLALAVRETLPTRHQIGHSMVAGMLMHGAYLTAAFWAISIGMPAGIVGLIVGLQPLLTAQFGRLIGERITRRNWIGLLIGLIGVTMVIGPKLEAPGDGISVAGVLAGFAGVVAISAGSIYQKRFGGGTAVFSGTACQFLGGFLVAFVGACLFENFRIDFTIEFLLTLAWMVLVLSIGAVSLLTLLIKHGSVAKIAGMFYLVPGVTALMTWILFGEDLTPFQILGMVICMGGVALASRGMPSRDSPAER